jgi:hypothetical protein
VHVFAVGAVAGPQIFFHGDAGKGRHGFSIPIAPRSSVFPPELAYAIHEVKWLFSLRARLDTATRKRISSRCWNWAP